MKKFFLFLFIALLGVAHADGLPLMRELLDLGEWMTNAEAALSGLRAGIATLSYPLVICGFILGALGIAMSNGNAILLFNRIFLAAILLGLATPINTLAIASWNAIRNYSTATIEQTFRDAHTQFMELSGGFFELETMAMTMGSNTVNVPSTETAIPHGAYMIVAFLILGAVTIFLMLVLAATGIAVNLAGLTIPIGAALMAFNTSTGSLWIGAYVRVMVGSLFFILILPPVFQITFDLAVVRSVTAINARVAEHQQDFDAIMGTNTDEATAQSATLATQAEAVAAAERELAEFENDEANYVQDPETPGIYKRFTDGAAAAWNGLKNTVTTARDNLAQLSTDIVDSLYAEFQGIVSTITNVVYTILFAVIVMILGILAALFMIFKVEAYSTALIGGVAIGVAQSMMNVATTLVSMVTRQPQQLIMPSESGGGAGGAGRSLPQSPPAVNAVSVPDASSTRSQVALAATKVNPASLPPPKPGR
jgi:hypothetical protein